MTKALHWPTGIAAVYYIMLVYGVLYHRWFDKTQGLQLLLTLDCIGIATTLAATGLPCLIRLFRHPDAPPASILVALVACVCNLLWATFSFLAGNYTMMIATSAAVCFGGLLALLSWF
ncbi:uncharacterized protein LOC9637799 [Selaginella moellendorffii]|nr:uncharacterized protein LOC9637799 [Selaginella moellendorffii]|eukprot:XP_024533797.1 uncharacterized protein LOC9637799 [Selaginella moellendorffii]